MNQLKETTKKERFSYFSYFLGQNILFILVSMYAMLFFTDYVGVSPAIVGVIFVIARVWDAVNDPLFGIIVDKSNPKKGKYKSWTSFAAILLPVLIVLMFWVPNISMAGKIVYVSVIYIMWGMAYTISDVPAFSLTTAMTNNMEERNSLLSVSRLFPIIGGLLVSMTIIALTNAIGWTAGVAIVALISAILMNFMRFNVKEHHIAPNTGVSIKKMIGYVLGNKYLLIYYAAFTVYSACNTGIFVNNYFAIYNLGSANYIAILSIINTVPMVIVALLASRLCAKFGKYKVTVTVCLLMIVTAILYFLVGYQSLPVVFCFSFINSSLTGFMAVMYPMFTSDCIEYGMWKSGERATGISFSIQTFTTKLGQALASGIVGVLLSVIGYTANTAQNEATLKGIFIILTLVPGLGALLMLIIFGLFYKLRESDVEKYIKENASKEIAA